MASDAEAGAASVQGSQGRIQIERAHEMSGLYDNLEASTLALQLKESEDELAEAERTREELRHALDAAAAREQALRERNATLARNISALFATAKLEIGRKDEKLAPLRRQRAGLREQHARADATERDGARSDAAEAAR